MVDLTKELDNALRVISDLSRDAKAEGDLPTMYKANQAWHVLYDASDDRSRRHLALSNGERDRG